jgi:hypothetical protein
MDLSQPHSSPQAAAILASSRCFFPTAFIDGDMYYMRSLSSQVTLSSWVSGIKNLVTIHSYSYILLSLRTLRAQPSPHTSVTITYDDDDQLFGSSPIIALRCFPEVVTLGICVDPCIIDDHSPVLGQLIFHVGRGAEDLIKFCAIFFRRPKKYSNDDIKSLISPVGLVRYLKMARGALCKRRG